jgi:hypothetical protein
MMIKVRKNMVGLPTFAKTFGVNIKIVRRLADNGYLPGELLDTRIYIDMTAVKSAAAAEGLTIDGYIKQKSDHTCNNCRGGFN